MTQRKGFTKQNQFLLHISPTESAILERLIERHGTEEEGMSQLEMLEELDKAKSTISEAVKWLEDNDFVKREERDGQRLVLLKNPDLFQTN